jgi:hypothetical protein
LSEYITARELSAHLDPMKDDISEIKRDVKGLVAHEYSNSWFGGRGRTALVVLGPMLLSILAAVLIALFLN